MNISYPTWLGVNGLKQQVQTKKLTLQRNDEGNAWYIFALEGNLIHEARIYKNNSEDHVDLNASFASLTGVPVNPMAPTHGYFQEAAHFKGFLVSASGVDTDTLYDSQIQQEIYVHGGWYWSDGGVIGDYAEFSVVDKDDVLGYFQYYGLVSGVDVLELGKYVETVYLKPGGGETVHLETPTIAPVFPGLYMRTKIHTTSETPLHLSVTYLWFEA